MEHNIFSQTVNFSCYVKFECKHICMYRYLQLLVTSSHYNQVLFYAQCKFRSDFVSIKMYCCNLWSQINIIDSLCLSVRCVFTIKCFVSRIICISSLVWNLLNFDYSCSSNIIYTSIKIVSFEIYLTWIAKIQDFS